MKIIKAKCLQYLNYLSFYMYGFIWFWKHCLGEFSQIHQLSGKRLSLKFTLTWNMALSPHSLPSLLFCKKDCVFNMKAEIQLWKWVCPFDSWWYNEWFNVCEILLYYLSSFLPSYFLLHSLLHLFFSPSFPSFFFSSFILTLSLVMLPYILLYVYTQVVYLFIHFWTIGSLPYCGYYEQCCHGYSWTCVWVVKCYDDTSVSRACIQWLPTHPSLNMFYDGAQW